MSIADHIDDPDPVLDHLTSALGPTLEADEVRALAAKRAERDLDPIEALRRIRAMAELLALSEEKAVARAATAGHTQRQIGQALGKPQTQIYRILKRARVNESDIRVSPREVILRYWIGSISEGMMEGLLWNPTEGRSAGGLHDEGYSADDWDEIRTAYLDGLLTESEYNALRKTKTSTSGRRRR